MEELANSINRKFRWKYFTICKTSSWAKRVPIYYFISYWTWQRLLCLLTTNCQQILLWLTEWSSHMMWTTRSIMNFGDCWSTVAYPEKVKFLFFKARPYHSIVSNFTHISYKCFYIIITFYENFCVETIHQILFFWSMNRRSLNKLFLRQFSFQAT